MQHASHHTPGHSLKTFAPLIGIALVLLIVATIHQVYFLDAFNLSEGMRVFMAGFFIIFGLLKVVNWREFADLFAGYDVVAMRSKEYAYLYPLIELGLGVSYAMSFALFYVNIITVVIMGVGALGVYLKLRVKEVIPCACLGGVFKLPMTTVTLVEDLLMGAMALTMLLI